MLLKRKPSITLAGRRIPCEDVISITPVAYAHRLYSEFVYRVHAPREETLRTLVERDKAYGLELKVRKAQN